MKSPNWTQKEIKWFIKYWPKHGVKYCAEYLGRTEAAIKTKAHKLKLQRPQYPSGNKNPKWTGYGEIPGSLWKQLLNNANRRNIPVLITIEQAWKLFLQQNGKCALTGRPIKFQSRKFDNTHGTASLDRKDSNKSYTIDNVQWVHKKVNLTKWDCTQEEYIQICNLVAQTHPRKSEEIILDSN